jgi:hypothetical protein
MSNQSFAHLEYDPDYYDVDVARSVGPMKHVLDVAKYENEQRCSGFDPEMNNVTNPSELTGEGKLGRYSRVIDEESDLRLLNYRLSKNPSKQYMPSNKSNANVNFSDCPPGLRAEVSRYTNPVIDYKGANVERFIYEDPNRNYQTPMYRQGHVEETRYNVGGGANSRLMAKDEYTSKNTFTSRG